MVRNGTLITPPVSDNILEGIVRASVMRIAADLKVPLEVRSIDRTELYVADELFLCGTGAQLAPVTSVDHRKIGDGSVGTITQKLSAIYFDAVHGKNERYKEWVTPVYTR
jgi:branched-chain amino acid aminotransferase